MKVVEWIRNMPRSVKASFSFLLASVISSGIAYLSTPIYTRLLTPEEYGQVDIYFSTAQILGIVAMFSLSSGIFNNGMIDYPDKRDAFSLSMLFLSNTITICFSFVLIATYSFWREYSKLDFKLIVLMLTVFLFQPAYNFWTARQKYELKYKWTLIWSSVLALISPLCAVFCLLNDVGSNHVYDRLFGSQVPLIVLYSLFYFFLFRKAKWKIDTSYWKTAFLFNLPLIPHYLSTYVLASSDRLMISYLISDSATAYYSVAYSVAGIAMIIWSAINSVLIPFTYENCKAKNYKSISRITILLLLAFGIVCVTVSLFAPEVVSIMATPEYLEAIYVIPPVIAGVFFQVQYFIYANIIFYYKKPRYVMYGSITSAVVNVILNIFFIRWLGYIGAAYTTLFCYALQALIDYWVMRKVLGFSIYNSRLLLLLSGTVLLAVFSCILIYPRIIVRYSIIALIVLACIIFRKRILSLIPLLKKTRSIGAVK